MVAIPAIRGFGGMIPKLGSQVLPDNMAELTYNCDLSSGELAGLPVPELVHTSTTPGTIRKAYRFPDPDGVDVDAWLSLPSEFSSVVRSPLSNDTTHRLYWTNPGDETPHWSTYFDVLNGNPPYDLGIVQPGSTPSDALTVGVVGGSAPTIYRSYCYTYVNQFDEESAPNFPSTVVGGPSDGVWTVTGMPTTAPANPLGRNYPTVLKLRLYRTLAGATTGGQFFLITEFVFGSIPPTSPYTDTVTDVSILGGPSQVVPLPSTGWANPPDELDGLVAMPSGMLVGFVGNTVYFCEPNRPHTWPAAYDQSLGYTIVGLTLWQQALVALTKGFPSTGSGNAPSNFIFTTVRAAEPCIARGSIVTDLSGVYYASQNGLIQLSGYGAQNQSVQLFTKNIWLTEYAAEDIVACRHRTQYLAINGSGVGFFLDYAEPRNGVIKLSSFVGAVSVWNDEYSGDAYVMDVDKKIYRWDSPNTALMNYRWRSKLFFLPTPTSLGACFIVADPTILTAVDAGLPALSAPDVNLVLPAGVNAVFKLYRGREKALVLTRNLRKTKEIFRTPAGAKSHHWQCEIVSRVPISSIELSSTMKELRSV